MIANVRNINWLEYFLRLADHMKPFSLEQFKRARDSALNNWPSESFIIIPAFQLGPYAVAAKKIVEITDCDLTIIARIKNCLPN